MSDPVVALESATVAHRSNVVLEGVSVAVAPASLTAVVGANGAGKTTLVRALAGLAPVSIGRRVGRPDVTYVAASVMAPAVSPRRWLAGIGVEHAGLKALDLLGFDGPLDASARVLSFGNLRKVLLAGVLARQADLHVLDEPENGLDEHGISALSMLVEAAVAGGAAVVVAGHHGSLLDRAGHVVTVANGAVTVEMRTFETTKVTFEGPEHILSRLREEARRLGARWVDP